MRLLVGLAVGAAALGAPAIAAAQERTAYTQIVSGDFRAAEQKLAAERRIFPQRPELMLNLAAVYGRTSRDRDAAALYKAVLAQPNVEMDVGGDRTAWSHDLAQAGLRRLTGTQLSLR